MAKYEILRMPTAAGNAMEMKRYEDVIFPNYDNLDTIACLKYAKEIEYRDGDILLCTYPKSGTHWLGNMIWKLNTLDPSKRPADSVLEFGPPELYDNMESPRIFFTHLKPSRLPDEHLRNRGKIVLMLRNPKDAMISYYEHIKNAVMFKSKQTWEEFFESYTSGICSMGSYFDYVQQWEEFLKSKPTDHHVEVFYYEEFKASLRYNIARLNFSLGFKRDEKYIEKVIEGTTLSALREQDAAGKRETVDMVRDEKGDSVIYRKGEVGGWKNYLTVAQSEYVDKLLGQSLKHGILRIKDKI